MHNYMISSQEKYAYLPLHTSPNVLLIIQHYYNRTYFNSIVITKFVGYLLQVNGLVLNPIVIDNHFLT